MARKVTKMVLRIMVMRTKTKTIETKVTLFVSNADNQVIIEQNVQAKILRVALVQFSLWDILRTQTGILTVGPVSI